MEKLSYTIPKITRAILNLVGKEINDPKPKIIHTPINKPPTLQEQIQRLMKNQEWNNKVQEAGYETEEEANDFDLEEDPEPHNPYPVIDMEPEFPSTKEPDTEPGAPLKSPSVVSDPVPDPKQADPKSGTENNIST